jgi:hypothetical protein
MINSPKHIESNDSVEHGSVAEMCKEILVHVVSKTLVQLPEIKGNGAFVIQYNIKH